MSVDDAVCVFEYTGTLIQVTADKGRSGLGRLGSFSSSYKDGRKESVRIVFLFTNHLLLTTRASSGRLHLAKVSQLGSVYLVLSQVLTYSSISSLAVAVIYSLKMICNDFLVVKVNCP